VVSEARQLAVLDNEAWGQHPLLTYLARVGPVTRRVRAYRAEQLASWLSNGAHTALGFPWHQLRYPEILRLRASLEQKYAPGTANHYLHIVRGLCKENWRLGLINSEEYGRIADIPGIPDHGPPAGRDVEPEELAALLKCAGGEGSIAGIRDAAIMAVLYGTGMRRAEVSGIALSNYDPHDCSFSVLGKGNRRRVAYAPEWVRQPIAAWLEVRGVAPGALFCGVQYNRVDRTYRHLSPRAVWDVVKRRAAQAGLPPLTTHDLRRTYVGDMLDQGVDQPTIARNVGHSTAMVARYDRRGRRSQQHAASLLPNPFVPAK